MISTTVRSDENNKNGKVFVALRVLISALLVFIVVTNLDIKAMWSAFASLDPVLYAYGLVIFLLSTGLLWAMRWQKILNASGVQIKLWPLIKYNFVGSFFSLFLPTAIGGDLPRLVDISQQTEKFADALSSILLDRIIGLLSLLLLALFAVLLGNQIIDENAVYISLFTLLLFLALTWALFFNSRVSGWVIRLFHLPILMRALNGIQNFYSSLQLIYQSPVNLTSALGISLIAQILEIVSVMLLALSIDIRVPSVYYFVFVPIIWVLAVMPISVGGVGIREGAFVLLFSYIGVSPSKAVVLSMLVYSCRFLMGLSGGVITIRQFNTYFSKISRIFNRNSGGYHE